MVICIMQRTGDVYVVSRFYRKYSCSCLNSYIVRNCSNHPSVQPSAQPSMQPSNQPSMQARGIPSSQPSALPTLQPTKKPVSTIKSIDSLLSTNTFTNTTTTLVIASNETASIAQSDKVITSILNALVSSSSAANITEIKGVQLEIGGTKVSLVLLPVSKSTNGSSVSLSPALAVPDSASTISIANS